MPQRSEKFSSIKRFHNSNIIELLLKFKQILEKAHPRLRLLVVRFLSRNELSSTVVATAPVVGQGIDHPD